jgi:hypothetical protein
MGILFVLPATTTHPGIYSVVTAAWSCSSKDGMFSSQSLLKSSNPISTQIRGHDLNTYAKYHGQEYSACGRSIDPRGDFQANPRTTSGPTNVVS